MRGDGIEMGVAMTKLLTEEELYDHLIGLLPDVSGHTIVHIAKFIQSQKQAHGDMVIGANSKRLSWTHPTAFVSQFSRLEHDKTVRIENNLRGQQRKRNKL